MMKIATDTALNINGFIDRLRADFDSSLKRSSGRGFENYVNEALDSKKKQSYGRLYLLCREFLKNNPDNLYAIIDLLEVYLRVGRLDSACQILEKLYSKYSSSSIYSSLAELREYKKQQFI